MPERLALLFVHVYVLSVDYAFVFLGFGSRTAAGLTIIGWRCCSCGIGLVEHFSHLVRSGGQLLLRSLQLCYRGSAFERLARFGESGFNLSPFAALHLIAGLFQHLFDVVGQRVEGVAGFNLLALFLVFSCVGFGFLGHALHFLFAQA